MSEQREIEKEISHLDFEPDEPNKYHWAHPITPGMSWCGIKMNNSRIPGLPGARIREPKDITCVDCLHLWIEKGPDWWVSVNRAWYNR